MIRKRAGQAAVLKIACPNAIDGARKVALLHMMSPDFRNISGAAFKNLVSSGRSDRLFWRRFPFSVKPRNSGALRR
jgi:hypothetical protein